MTTSGVPGTAAEAVRELRGIAHEWVDGRYAEPQSLIQAALRALVAGVDTPSLWLLAWLLSGEEDQAPGLFDRVTDELGFGLCPLEEYGDYWQGRLALARWWAAEIVGGWLDPFEGAGLIVENVAEAYGECEELAPMVDAVAAYLGHGGSQVPAQEIAAHLTRAAGELLTRIPPPPGPP
ncbi:hypothetical protein PUR71_13020 [Streptomyces sp. SP17BM10]|uniref:hypothetical protein n=1 Tax=Streptomyces sp. SP17BM10 TaxID=3002530 RepID=UPI002E7A7799|nr:hypothetical protein [Streptomyces sp. SP17BM10]MEE1783822.1 hypothetical protein [Streptomyces sp. SP17BM10]